MSADLDALLTCLYVLVDDLLPPRRCFGFRLYLLCNPDGGWRWSAWRALSEPSAPHIAAGPKLEHAGVRRAA